MPQKFLKVEGWIGEIIDSDLKVINVKENKNKRNCYTKNFINN